MTSLNKALPDPCDRQLLHKRTIVCEGYLRHDNFFDIEAQMIDTKSYRFSNPHRGSIHPGEPLHDMRIRLTIDQQLKIHDAVAATAFSPYLPCSDIAPAYKQLIGLSIAPGWTRQVKRIFTGELGCTHLTELLIPMATVAMQTVFSKNAQKQLKSSQKISSDKTANTNSQKSANINLVGTCYALRRDGDIAHEFYHQKIDKI